MITQLRIHNFKGWQDTGDIRMAPITLFFGVNSSGKSSIGQFLMMLKQTAASPDRKAVFFPGSTSSPVQLGSYQEMVYRRNEEHAICCEYDWDLDKPLAITDDMSTQQFKGDQLHFEAKVSLSEKKRIPIVDRLLYRLAADNTTCLTVEMERKPQSQKEYRVSSPEYHFVRKQGRAWSPGAPVRFYGFPDEVVAYHQNADFVQQLNLKHEQLFRGLSYLGPLRTKAERLYSWAGIEPESVGFAGENTVGAILAARDRKIGIKKPDARRCSPAKPFEQIIAEALKTMGLIEAFEVNPISKTRQEYEVKVRARGSKDKVDLPDVGFGISQVLPVLVECFYAPANSIILMEQPEIHLHPSAQAALADVMIDAINAKEDGLDRNIQLIVETHSEHFLRRLQRRVAESRVDHDRVSAYFADVSVAPAQLRELDVDLFGNIKNWPTNFFGDEMADITGQAKAAMLKQKSLNEPGGTEE